MANMVTRLVFPSSFDSTRYTAIHPRDDHPNLAQAQTEAITTLLLGRPLGVTNTYAFDSRTVLSLIQATLETRDAVAGEADPAGKERIDNAAPFRLRWYAPTDNEKDFLSCCAEQLRRLEPGRRFVLSHWKKIDNDNEARMALADALTAEKPRFPASLRELDPPQAGGTGELEHSFDTLIRLNAYCEGRPERGAPSGKSHLSLLDYVQDFESLEGKELRGVMDGKIDIDTVRHLQESVSSQPRAVKGARSWAHRAVEEAGGEYECRDFLLHQRQLIDTLYNAALADSVGSNHDLLSSVPRTVGSEKLEEVNLFALNLIRFSKRRRLRELAEADGTETPGTFDPATNLSEIFVDASAERELPASPVRDLLTAYWQLIAESDTWQAWQDSADYLEDSYNRALKLRAAGRRVDSRLSQAWHAHLEMLQDRLPYVKKYEGNLATAIQLSGKEYCTLTGFREPSATDDTMAAGEYIDRYLRGRIR